MHEDDGAEELRRILAETAPPEAPRGGITVIGYDHTTINVHPGAVTSSVTTGRKQSASLVRRKRRG